MCRHTCCGLRQSIDLRVALMPPLIPLASSWLRSPAVSDLSLSHQRNAHRQRQTRTYDLYPNQILAEANAVASVRASLQHYSLVYWQLWLYYQATHQFASRCAFPSAGCSPARLGLFFLPHWQRRRRRRVTTVAWQQEAESYQIVIKQVVKCDQADKQRGRPPPPPLHKRG